MLKPWFIWPAALATPSVANGICHLQNFIKSWCLVMRASTEVPARVCMLPAAAEEDDEPVDESGVEAKDIELVMTQVCT